MRYKDVNKNKKNGVVYTPSNMADYVAKLILKYSSKYENNGVIEILDPAVGGGELLISMIYELKRQGINHIRAVGYETDKEVANNTEILLKEKFPNVLVEIRVADFIFEVSNKNVGKFDYIIANPPYVRTQILGSKRSQLMAEELNLKGKLDIYYAFLLYTKKVLKDAGVAGYITSNKFMTIKSGKTVREYMLNNYKIHQIVDLGDTKMFTASVLPCIMVFSHGQTLSSDNVVFISIYEETNYHIDCKVHNLFGVIETPGSYLLSSGKTYKIQHGKIMSVDPNDVWVISTDDDVKFLDNVKKNTLLSFSQLGKIRVGIKTTADNVFIGEDWALRGKDIELLKPLITHRNAGQIVANNNSHWQVLYTHYSLNHKKVTVDINQYPNSKKYLEKHFEQLNARSYVKKANRNWFEIWVPQNPEAWADRKIVFRDIAEKPQFWFDETGAIVNGDCYWIDINENIDDDIIYLALAVANSTFIEKYYDMRFNNRLYSRKRRFQSQYVEQFPIPYFNTKEAKSTVRLVKKIIADQKYTDSDKQEIDRLVFAMFNC